MGKNLLVYRAMGPIDAYDVHKVRALVDTTYLFNEPPSEILSRMLWYLQNPQDRFLYIARSEGIAVGGITATRDLDTLVLQQLFTHPKFEGKKVATSLVEKFLEETLHHDRSGDLRGYFAYILIRQKQVRWETNEASLRILKKFGFTARQGPDRYYLSRGLSQLCRIPTSK